MQGCALGPAERPAAGSSAGRPRAGRKQPPSSVGSQCASRGGWRGEPGHADRGVLVVGLSGTSAKALWAPSTKRWLVGWENALTAALAPIHLPLLIAAGLKT